MSQPESVYVGAGTLRFLSWLLLAVAAVSIVTSAVLVVEAFSTSPASIQLPVTLADGADTRQADAYLATADAPGTEFTAEEGRLELTVPEPTTAERVLGSAGDVVLGLALAACAVLLRPVLMSIADGRPFAGRNARRLAVLAMVALLAVVLVPYFPKFAAMNALDRLGLTSADSPFLFGMELSLAPAILFPLAFLVIAEAFRHGEKLYHDVEGLV